MRMRKIAMRVSDASMTLYWCLVACTMRAPQLDSVANNRTKSSCFKKSSMAASTMSTSHVLRLAQEKGSVELGVYILVMPLQGKRRAG